MNKKEKKNIAKIMRANIILFVLVVVSFAALLVEENTCLYIINIFVLSAQLYFLKKFERMNGEWTNLICDSLSPEHRLSKEKTPL